MAIVSATFHQEQSPQTFAELKAEVARAFGGADDNEGLDIAGDAINDTIEYVNFERPWSFNLKSQADITTVAGTNEYTLASAYWKAYNCRKTDSIDYALTYLRRSKFDMLFESQTDLTGYPYAYTVFNEFDEGKVLLFPTPDGAYTIKIRYYQLTPRLVNASDVLSVPRPYSVVIKDGAIARACAYKTTEAKKIDFFERKFENGLARMVRDDQAEPDEHLRFINIEEFGRWSYLNPASRPRYLDLY